MLNEIKPEQVPHSAMNALLLALRRREGGKEAIAAALNAWPFDHMLTAIPQDHPPSRTEAGGKP